MQKVWRVIGSDGDVLGVLDSKSVAESIQSRHAGSRVVIEYCNADGNPLRCWEWLEGLLSLTADEAGDVLTNFADVIESAITHEAVAWSKFADLVNACDEALAGDSALIAARVALGYEEPKEIVVESEADFGYRCLTDPESISLRAALFNE